MSDASVGVGAAVRMWPERERSAELGVPWPAAGAVQGYVSTNINGGCEARMRTDGNEMMVMI